MRRRLLLLLLLLLNNGRHFEILHGRWLSGVVEVFHGEAGERVCRISTRRRQSPGGAATDDRRPTTPGVIRHSSPAPNRRAPIRLPSGATHFRNDAIAGIGGGKRALTGNIRFAPTEVRRWKRRR